MIGFSLAWVYIHPAGFEKSPAFLIASMVLGPPSVALAWAATRHLGKQWRYEAALSEHHELIQTGPYRWLRHPNYAVVIAEIAVVPLALGLPVFAVVFSAADAALMAYRIHVEKQALGWAAKPMAPATLANETPRR
jgi:isoprenylcysteine carboxyl methyltransferase (ICMT) family protein YpbQ